MNDASKMPRLLNRLTTAAVFLFLLLVVRSMAQAEVDVWHSAGFISLWMPPEWKAKARPIKEKDYEAVSDWGIAQLKLDYILAQLGLPDRYMRGSKDDHFYLVYEFEGRHTLVVYLDGENSQGCLAAALLGPGGKNIKLIK
ncbi:hypothetical protein BH09VER1_BH09VER1_21340 [soil metagenome]